MREFQEEITDLTEKRGFSLPVPDRLLPGTVIHERYRIGLEYERKGVMAIYFGTDTTLRRRVDIIEFLPAKLSERDNDGVNVRETGTDGAYRDAKTIYRKNIDMLNESGLLESCDGACDLFEENNTVYLVCLSTGKRPLCEYIGKKSHSRFSPSEIITILRPIARAIKEINAKGFHHGNISPDSIFTDGKDSILRYNTLIAFPNIGVKDYRFSAPSRVWSAPELTSDKVSPGLLSDCYSLGAVAYRLLTGYAPSDCSERMAVSVSTGVDSLVPISRYRPFADKKLTHAVEAALSLKPEGRDKILEVLMGER